MIRVVNVSKYFGENQVLKNININFDPGKTNLIIGQSGSGKTVLLKCIIGLLYPESGEIYYDDRNVLKMNEYERKFLQREIGVVFQGGALFDSLTVEQNVMFPLDIYSDWSYEEKLARVNFCLERVNLENANNLYPAELSGGMKKRVAIARAIALNPKYLFCDEPNSGLDPLTAIVIDKLISSITKEYNITTVINTHDMNSVMEIGDKIAFIYKGHLWWEGTNKEILNSDNPEINEFVYATELTKRLKK